MKGIYNFVIEPVGERYNNVKKIGDKDLILNTKMFTHQFVNREGLVLETPIINDTGIQKGDIVVVHHNIFRRYQDIRGEEKNSKSYINKCRFIIY